MAIKTIDAGMLQKMFLAGAKNLESKKEWINELNVFPVPDGDTGTNMTMTIMSAAKEVSAIENPQMAAIAKAVSGGSLRGARGNSGVILSQLFRGFTKEISSVEAIDCVTLAKASERAVETAYKAVMKPKEGTILTVAKGASQKAMELALEMENVDEMIAAVIEEAKAVLAKTPDMLPVLKQAGVVDSGGQGLVVVLEGAYDALMGKEVVFDEAPAGEGNTQSAPSASGSVEADIRFGYCTEFIVMLEKPFTSRDEVEFKAYLESIGDSIVCVADDEIVKIHVHTNDPGLAIQKGLSYGSLTKMKIDNMREEHQEKVIKEADRKAALEEEKKNAEPAKEYGFISVSAGEGLSEVFKGLGADYIIEGGQTMNPSTEDMLNAIDCVNAKTIFILPNNSNIILAAQQAASICEDKKIVVIPSKTIPQGITAMINFESNKTVEENTSDMTEALGTVKSGQVTYAVRDTNIDDKEIHQGDFMGIGDKTILSVGKDINETVLDLVSKLVDDESSLISLYFGQEVTEETAQALAASISEAYPDIEIETVYGGQPIYYYILSVEA